MGSPQSKECLSHGEICIATDSPSFKPGDLVRGNVYINMKQSFSTPSLNLNLKVEEFTHFNKSQDHKLHFQGQTIIVKFRQNLIPPGQYQYPFTFTLPLNLPGSFEYYDNENTAYITYILEASLPSLNPQNSIRNSVLLIVNQPLQSLGVCSRKESTAKLASLCCFPQGMSTLKVVLPNENFYNNDSVKVFCELDNRGTSLNGKNIKAKLIQNILLKDNLNRSTLIQRKISKVDFKHFYPAREINNFTLEMPLIDHENPTRRFIEKCDHIFLLKNKDLVASLQASTASQLITCSYILEMEACFDGYLMTSSKPEVKVPIALYIPDVRVNTSAPREWNPTVLPEMRLDFPTKEDLGMQGIPQQAVIIQ